MNKSADNEFLFLSYSPNTRSRKDQELQEAERRAHAARRSHPSVRQRKSADSSPATAAANSPSPQDQLSDATDATHTNRNATQEIQRYSNRYNSTLAGPKVLRTLLGEGRYDPFSVFAVQDIPAYVHKMLDAAAHLKWVNLKPSRASAVAHPIRRAWMRTAMESPAALHAIIYAMYRSIELLNGSSESEKLLGLKHHTRSLTFVQQEIQSLGGNMANDSLLLALTILAAHGEPLDNRDSYKEYPQSPLARTQNLHIYGSVNLVVEHMQAVYFLVEQRGYDDIELFGLWETMEITDLMYATRVGTTPRFPWRHAIQPLQSDRDYVLDMHAQQLLATLGSAFDTILGSHPRLVELLALMCGTTVALDQYHRNSPMAPSLPALVGARNAVQHGLLCLPPTDLTAGNHRLLTYEICRVSMLVFSDMVLFPMSPATGVNARLVTSLRDALHFSQGEVWDACPTLLIWAAMLGGIASSSTPHRSWYVNFLQEQSLLLSVSWEILEDVMSTYLWWDYVCSGPGEKLWREACSCAGQSVVKYKVAYQQEDQTASPL